MPDDAADNGVDERQFQLRKLEEIRAALDDARKTGNWEQVPDAVYRDYLQKIVLTSAPALANYLEFSEIGFISAEHVYTLDLPPLGGETAPVVDNSAAEFQLEQANKAVMSKLRANALQLNAEAVIAVDIKHVLLDSDHQQKRFVVIAVGTAVQVESE